MKKESLAEGLQKRCASAKGLTLTSREPKKPPKTRQFKPDKRFENRKRFSSPVQLRKEKNQAVYRWHRHYLFTGILLEVRISYMKTDRKTRFGPVKCIIEVKEGKNIEIVMIDASGVSCGYLLFPQTFCLKDDARLEPQIIVVTANNFFHSSDTLAKEFWGFIKEEIDYSNCKIAELDKAIKAYFTENLGTEILKKYFTQDAMRELEETLKEIDALPAEPSFHSPFAELQEIYPGGKADGTSH